ncbi:hypothetical protein COCMIDRAFT_28419 [Bipolaris oryzae ATCC 44560]|uniref:Uncharacterized protein n=1 Tax=Bipolaris oryzae ATCC 44560 TaxID=930090 RepID=W6ZHL0_COCMI|nr:uncharacterized protein COCMIDRAFT_28419 [Bipolaris oryzae ATCC 44560]EUC43046.1 hypothetical protein COCMIDRAFT_28419 [Bipolaris oryzae ATCC 44560]
MSFFFYLLAAAPDTVALLFHAASLESNAGQAQILLAGPALASPSLCHHLPEQLCGYYCLSIRPLHLRAHAVKVYRTLFVCTLSGIRLDNGDSTHCPICLPAARIHRRIHGSALATGAAPAIAMQSSMKTRSSLGAEYLLSVGIVVWPGEQASSASPGRRVGASVGMVRRATWAHIFIQSPRLHKSAQKKPNVAITSASMSRRRAIERALLHPSPLRRVVMRSGAATARALATVPQSVDS